MLDAGGAGRCNPERRVPSTTGLDAGLLVSGKHAVARGQRLASPATFVQVEDAVSRAD